MAGLYGRPRVEAQRDLDEGLERLQIAQYRNRKVNEISSCAWLDG